MNTTKIKSLTNKFLAILIRPFTHELIFLLCALLLACSVDVYRYIHASLYKYAIYIFAHGLLSSYIISLLICLCPKHIRTIFKIISLFCLVTMFAINIYCILTYKQSFNLDIAAILLGTNPSEAIDFIYSSITKETIILITASLAIIISLLKYSTHRKLIISTKVGYIALIVVLCSSFLCIHNPSPWKEVFFGEIKLFTEVPIVPDLHQFYTHPKIKKTSKQPENIVVIFGESLTKTHCSLYGYPKNTNPYLSALKNNSTLCVYDSIKSSGLHTIESFKAMMSLYREEFGEKKDWFRFTSLPEIINSSSYKSTWISNQSKTGIFDNVIGKYAELCDQNIFVGNKYSGWQRTSLDEETLNIIKGQPKDSLSFFFVHLMGNHVAFESRYPKEFSKFKESDYLNYPKHQRHNYATYDNSVLYNDSVVYEVIQQFKDKEAIVFYFSDHAIDFYDSSDDYVGHAKANDPVSAEAGYKIPFMIYCSEKYKQAFPEMYKKVKENVHKPYRTENLIYTAMDVMGVKFADNDDVKKYSLFSQE